MAGDVERGDVRLFTFPAPDKPRPVLVLTRSSAIRYLIRVTVAPITSTLRGASSEVALDIEDGMKQPCAVNLHNLVTVAKSGLGRRLAQIRPGKMSDVCQALGCDASRIRADD